MGVLDDDHEAAPGRRQRICAMCRSLCVLSLWVCSGAGRSQPASRLSLRICLSKTRAGAMRRSVLARPAKEPAV